MTSEGLPAGAENRPGRAAAGCETPMKPPSDDAERPKSSPSRSWTGTWTGIGALMPWKGRAAKLRAARNTAERANARKSQLLATVSHELRTSLNVIHGFSQIMRLERFGAIGNARYQEYIEDIHASSEHLLALVNDLLDLSMVEAGRWEPDLTAVRLADIAEHCVRIMRDEAEKGGIKLTIDCPKHLPDIMADRRSIRQIILNLLSNAIKFTPSGGTVGILLDPGDRGTVRLKVRDNGIGMAEANLTRALGAFQRVDTPERQRTIPGAGLGLSLAKALVEANHAAFAILSKPGHGTTVEITFPAPDRAIGQSA
ncbi:MAG: HAMP domain-containing sensor histidine kinase [Hyphomicrobiales bacterium]